MGNDEDTASKESAFRHALKANPNDIDSYRRLGLLYHGQGRWEESEAVYVRALRRWPRCAELHNEMGVIHECRQRPWEAEACYRQAITLRPDLADAHNNLGCVLHGRGLMDVASLAYQRAIELDPDCREAMANLVSAAAHVCDWPRVAEISNKVLRNAKRAVESGGNPVLMPFTALSIGCDPELQRRIAEHFVARFYPEENRLQARVRPTARSTRTRRIRLGYLSGDFRDHPVNHLARNLFVHHDRARFEVFCYSTGPDGCSEYRKHIEATCDSFIDIRAESSADAAKRITADGIDLLIDMSGHTLYNRLDVLRLRPAPVQIHYLGYPGTTGADFIDYFVTDRYLTPPGTESHFTEKLIFLPHCYQISDDASPPVHCHTSRADEGLPCEAFVYCTFNSSYKIEPRIFGTWMRILDAVPRSVLWLIAESDTARSNLRQAARGLGIDPDRLIFAVRKPRTNHLARLPLANLFLDTHYVSGHTTANDALRMGLPVLACPRDTFVSRVSSSLLNTLGLPELICPDLDSYRRTGVLLAQASDRLAVLRQKLQHQAAASPAFDTRRTVRDLERAYCEIWRRAVRGNAPEHLVLRSVDAATY